jgi:hypothetical protein
MNVRKRPKAGGIVVPNAMTNNALWTWDARMRWWDGGMDMPLGMAVPDAGFAFPYDTRFFVENYRRLIDEVAQWDPVPKVIIWGFLRDTHGGKRAALEVATHAAEQGVPLVAGVGSGGYGGVYYEGEHRYNAAHFLRRNPNLAVSNTKVLNGERTQRGMTVDPLNDHVLDWLAEGLGWLMREFPLAGVNLEIGDFFVPESLAARTAGVREEGILDEFLQTLVLHYRGLFERLTIPFDAMDISYANYSKPSVEKLAANPGFATALPDSAICQWTLTSADEESSLDGLLPRRNRGYGHFQSIANGSDARCLRREIAHMVEVADRHHFEGVSMYGEIPPGHGCAQSNYEAFQAYCRNPELALRERPAPRAGSGLAPDAEELV